MAKIEPVKNFPDIEKMVPHDKTKNSKDNYEQIKLEFSINNKKDEAKYLIEIKLFYGQLSDFIPEVQRANPNQIVNFAKFFTCNFYFQKEQEFQITLRKNNIPYEINTTLNQIVGSKDFIFKCIFSEDGDELIIKAEKLEKEDDLLDVKLSLENYNDPNYFRNNKFYYKIICKNRTIYSSGNIEDDGTFESMYIPTNILRPNYIIKIYNSQNERIYNFPNNIENIRQGISIPRKIFIKSNKNNVCLHFEDNSEIIKNYSFLEYVKAGVKIALSIGIDFSKSNKKNDLHSLNGSNNYEKAINACANIVGFYDNDQLFPVFGFGAKIKNSKSKKISHCFNLNFEENPDINGVDEIIRIYRECIEKEKLIFSGPTKFTPLINEVISRINKDDLYEYHILLILTDGVINDLDSTKDILVEASFLPLSVIIVGIGDADFSKMVVLDGDEEPLVNTKGEKRARDLVQFVPFSKYENDEKKLAMEVLAEIPRQLVEYYRFKKLNPEKLDNRRRPKIIEDKNPFNRFQNKDIRLPNNNNNFISSNIRDINISNIDSISNFNNFNVNNNLNNINNISIINKRNENFVDNSSYFSYSRRQSVDFSNSSKNIPISDSTISSNTKRPSSIYSRRGNNSKYIPSLQNLETNQNSSYKSYQTSSTQENWSHRDESSISIQKGKIIKNPFHMSSKNDKNNNNKQSNYFRNKSIDLSMSNKSSYNNNLDKNGYNPLITNGNEIINQSSKSNKRYYEDIYNGDDYFNDLKTYKTIRFKKNNEY